MEEKDMREIDEIRIEGDEDGWHLVIHLDYGGRQFTPPHPEERYRIGFPDQFKAEVDRTIGAWLAEGERARTDLSREAYLAHVRSDDPENDPDVAAAFGRLNTAGIGTAPHIACVHPTRVFYSQTRAAAALQERVHGRSSEMSSTPKIDTERLARLMAAFENGEVFATRNPFDIDDPLAFGTSRAGAMVAAFAAMAKSDTPKITGVGSDEHATALVVAGLLQGMWIGFEYAQRDAYGDEG